MSIGPKAIVWSNFVRKQKIRNFLDHTFVWTLTQIYKFGPDWGRIFSPFENDLTSYDKESLSNDAINVISALYLKILRKQNAWFTYFEAQKGDARVYLACFWENDVWIEKCEQRKQTSTNVSSQQWMNEQKIALVTRCLIEIQPFGRRLHCTSKRVLNSTLCANIWAELL